MKKMCQECNNTRANYGYDGNKYIWCSGCAKNNYLRMNIDIDRQCNILKLCIECNKSVASVGYDDKKRIWCVECASFQYQELNIDISRRYDSHKKCSECDNARANYGYDGNKYIWCSTCSIKKYQELNIGVSRQCDSQSKCNRCKKSQPMYGYDGNKYIWCSPCAEISYMELNIDISRQCNATNKCRQCNSTIAMYGYDDNKRIWCSPCANIFYTKLNIHVSRRCNAQPTCVVCNNYTASFGYDNKKRLWCSKCASLKYRELNIDVNRQCNSQYKCKTPLCDTSVTKKYKGYCFRCFIYLFPNEPVSRNYKTKETAVADFLKSNFPDITMTFDKKIEDGCSKRRPDCFIDMSNYTIVVEVDENQHVYYDCLCENKRTMQLFQDTGDRPLYLIRFNPDDYLDENNTNTTSCWGTDKRGLCVVKKTKQNEWQSRLAVLKECLTSCINTPPTKEVDVIHLFYDLCSN